jgi:hypothetical protein
MGKDREGKFHPQKGKPSGSAKSESTGLKEVNSKHIDNYLEIAEKYTLGEEEPAPNLRVTHPNRNVDKREERSQQATDTNNDSNESNKSKTETFKVENSDTVAEELLISITKEQLATLASLKSDPCISIYIETASAGVDKNEQKDLIAFKNVLQQVTYQLRQKGVSQNVIEKLLKPGYDLIRDNIFWSNLSKGLAVFISANELKYMKLPVVPKEEILINTSYYLAPLITLVSGYDYFYLMVLSKKQAKLYRADKFGMVYLPIPEMPNGIDDVVHLEEKDDQKLFRTESQGGGHGANYHGIGAGKPDDKANIAIYFDEVDETAMKAVLNKETVPLLLAGVEYLIPIYKSVADYKFIWDKSLTGSYEHQNGTAIYEEAREVMEPYFQQRNTKALEMYANNSATERTSSIPADVIPAAFYSRVWHLFVLKDEHIWGSFDEMKNELVVHESQIDGDECLIDKAIMKTVLNGGEVHFLERERMPADTKIAALMRY